MTPNDQDLTDSSTPPMRPSEFGGGNPSRIRLLFVSAHRYRRFAVLGVAFLCLVAAGLWIYERWWHVTENDARVKADMVIVSSRVDGWIAERPVTDGQVVEQGQEMIVIDQREAELKLAELRAKVESIHLREDRIAIQYRMVKTTASNAVTAAQSRQKAVTSKLEQARREFQRAEELLGRMVSREVWERRQTQLQQSEAEALSASAGLADAQVKLGDIDVLRKELDTLAQEAVQVDAQIRKQEINVADRRVRSPIDGVVDQKFVQPGEYVIPGQRLFLLHDPVAALPAASNASATRRPANSPYCRVPILPEILPRSPSVCRCVLLSNSRMITPCVRA